MLRFKIRNTEDSGFIFHFGNIKIMVKDYFIQDEQHLLLPPENAIAYFEYEHNIYGVSNAQLMYKTAEDLFEAISIQFRQLCDQSNKSVATNMLFKLNENLNSTIELSALTV
jgi:hypothetical protein